MQCTLFIPESSFPLEKNASFPATCLRQHFNREFLPAGIIQEQRAPGQFLFSVRINVGLRKMRSDFWLLYIFKRIFKYSARSAPQDMRGDKKEIKKFFLFLTPRFRCCIVELIMKPDTVSVF